GDGDLDIAVSEYDFVNTPSLGSLYWLENGGSGDTWTKHPLKPGSHWYSSIADMDGDGDLDITGSWEGIFWLENQLPATDWTLHQVVSSTANAHFVGVCDDLDGDGDADIASAPSETNGGLVYYANPGWQEVNINPTGVNLYIGPTGDIDGDGDTDIAYGGAGYLPQGLGWAENQNNGATWVIHDITPHDLIQRIPTGLEDIDGDGDVDIVSLTFDVNLSIGSVFWAANPELSGTSMPYGQEPSLCISPNPAGDVVKLQVESAPGALFHVEIFDLNGRLVKGFEISGGTTAGVDLAGLSAGSYVVKVFNENGMVVKRLVKI
ncbi:MAG: T9SS type A sorting domain-containing protein, partial [Bacteroidetes bacterium]|nr:T9SS type A sorting domain-containing protein [Bacteroidota bacterium]